VALTTREEKQQALAIYNKNKQRETNKEKQNIKISEIKLS
jgi:hypothetical protein